MRSVRDTLRLWFSFHVPVGPRDYLRHGAVLMALKYLVDATAVGLAAHVFWSPLDYLNPSLAMRLNRVHLPSAFLVGMAIWTLPFIWIGASMSVRRAVDTARSAWLGLLFFVPIVNYVVMIALCLLPSRTRAPDPWTAYDAPATGPSGAAGDRPIVDDRLASAFVGVAASLLIGLPLVAFCTLVLKNYGLALFFGTPFTMGVVTGYLHNRRRMHRLSETVLVATLGQALVAGAILLFAIEGLVCLMMALPFAIEVAWMGCAFGREIARLSPARLSHAALTVLILPPLATLESRWVQPVPVPSREVISSVVIDAPPEVVWRHVVSFDDLPPPHELLFRLGVAYPRRARIAGTGVGAVRRCEFSTGAFVEPITRWDAPRTLSFDVTSQPEPMKEWSPYRRVFAPHLANGFRAVRGEFRLTPLAGERTRLSGSTWYELRIQPGGYWSLWANGFVGAIHHRVLEHIRREAEQGAGERSGATRLGRSATARSQRVSLRTSRA